MKQRLEIFHRSKRIWTTSQLKAVWIVPPALQWLFGSLHRSYQSEIECQCFHQGLYVPFALTRLLIEEVMFKQRYVIWKSLQLYLSKTSYLKRPFGQYFRINRTYYESSILRYDQRHNSESHKRQTLTYTKKGFWQYLASLTKRE